MQPSIFGWTIPLMYNMHKVFALWWMWFPDQLVWYLWVKQGHSNISPSALSLKLMCMFRDYWIRCLQQILLLVFPGPKPHTDTFQVFLCNVSLLCLSRSSSWRAVSSSLRSTGSWIPETGRFMDRRWGWQKERRFLARHCMKNSFVTLFKKN